QPVAVGGGRTPLRSGLVPLLPMLETSLRVGSMGLHSLGNGDAGSAMGRLEPPRRNSLNTVYDFAGRASRRRRESLPSLANNDRRAFLQSARRDHFGELAVGGAETDRDGLEAAVLLDPHHGALQRLAGLKGRALLPQQVAIGRQVFLADLVGEGLKVQGGVGNLKD